jgi:group I intron endonuclease
MYVYLITNKINGKRYVGQTVKTIEERWKQHVYLSKQPRKGEPIISAIRKYGSDNFEIKSLARCNSLEEMNHREEYYIRLLKTLVYSGYNVLPGGNNRKMHESTKKKLSLARIGKKIGPFSEEHRRKLSEANKGQNLGGTLPEETKRKISEANKGEKNYMFGKKQTENNKKATSEANRGNKYWVGRKHSQESKDKMAKSKIGKCSGSKNPFFGKKHTQEVLDKLLKCNERRKVKIFCINNNTEYQSISHASRDLGIDRSQIRGVLNNKTKNAKGFVFRKV